MKTQKRRKLEGKTDYAKRKKLLSGNCPRVIFRKTNKYILAQYVISKEARDRIELGVTSKELLGVGWPKDSATSLKSIPAAYLTGLLFGRKINEKKLDKNVILDKGMIRNIHKNKFYAFMKGLVDAGLQLKYKGDIFPDEKRLYGEHLKKRINVEKIKEEIKK